MPEPIFRTPSATASTDGLSASPAGRRLQRLSKLMDSSITLPGGFRIGWDGIIGLIPGIGDLIGLGVSAWIVLGAARLGASKATLLRMGVNVGVETLVGAVPIVGDLFDLAFKANERNMRLLARHAGDPVRATRRSRAWLVGTAIAILGVALLLGWFVVAMFLGIVGLIF